MSNDARFPILATAVIPWTDALQFDEPCFRRQVQTIAEGITRHIYIFGTAGEGYAVTDRQFAQIATAFWHETQNCRVQAVLGVISLSLGTVLERLAFGYQLGYREFQLSLPCWGALNDEELIRFFDLTCGAYPDCRFHHYNLLRSRRLLTGPDYVTLASRHPNLVAVKASTDDPAKVADLLQAAPRLQFYLTEFGYEIARRERDGIGLLLALSSINYERARAFVSGDREHRAAEIPDLRGVLDGLLEVGAGRYHIDGAYDKMLFRMHDPSFPLRILPPYSSASENDFEKFRLIAERTWRRPSPAAAKPASAGAASLRPNRT